MTKLEVTSFNLWWNNGIAHPVNIGYDCAKTAWKAACIWQKNQIKDYLDKMHFELPEDIYNELFK